MADLEDGILEIRPNRSKRIEEPFFLGAVGPFDAVVRAMWPRGPRCFEQPAGEPLDLLGPRPLGCSIFTSASAESRGTGSTRV
ncbi:MAG: hypothetical protein HY700_04005 [Gemmatimonadetes bacterium]|nr:hypothetical protein [Gemmatimonadota bacterium]